MSRPQRQETQPMPQCEQYDAIIVGAGISGLYQLYRLRELGLKVRVLEAGGGVGGTWYWNRYPGARFDSESYSYGFSFSTELLQEWEWSEHFSAQPETLRYVNFVADKFDLRRDIRFHTRVVRAAWSEDRLGWEIEAEDGYRARADWFVTALGPLSVPQMPRIDGMEDFRGRSFHTAEWPREPLALAGKRVGVIGTGATAVQLIQEIAATVGRLTVFQRSPNWCAPLHNSPIDAETQARIKAGYDEMFAFCRTTHGGFIHDADRRKAMEVLPEEREAFYEKLYGEPGFGIWMGNFRDTFVDEAANRTLSEFVARKIRARVRDPEIAEKLIPKDHGFGTRRVPMENGYYEVFNRDNVRLVDIGAAPIERIAPDGVVAGGEEHPLDILVYATGFDAVTGAFDRIDIRGREGLALRDKWADGPKTFLGIQIAGFPNMFTLVGPHNAASFCNIPRCSEQNVEWVAECLRYMRARGIRRVEARAAAEAEWTEHVHESAARMLYSKVDSWFMGVNSNRADKSRRIFLLYGAGAPLYRERCEASAANGYAGFELA